MSEAPANVSGVSAAFAGDAEVGQAKPGQQEETPPEADHSRYRQLRDRLQQELNQRSERISNDPQMDQGTKYRELNNLWNMSVEGDRKIGELYEKELQGNVAEQEKKVFRIPPNMMDSVRSSYQMISNEIAYVGIEEGEGIGAMQAAREKLETMYERAVRTRDRALQLAIYQYAVEKGIHHLRDRHLETSGELSRAWSGYTAARQKLANWNDREENLIQRLDGRRGIVKPPEIR